MNTFGRKFRVTVFGESHGEAIGVVLDGVPAGIALSEKDFETDILRRKSGARGTTPRTEADEPVILSGVYESHTTGAPLAIIFRNTDTRSGDYSLFSAMPRPGHADLVAAMKWGRNNDPRGGGYFSGRMTLPIVAAGVVAKKVLSSVLASDGKPECRADARIVELGGIPLEGSCTTESLPEAWTQAIETAMQEGDSLGAVVECVVSGVGAGYGEPFWDSVESVLSHAMFSIPGVRAVGFGDGFQAARMKGSEHNDPIGPEGVPLKNGAGGINGGITNGAPIVLRVAFKPTSSIRKSQDTYNFETQQMGALEIPGRHDVCFALRTPVVVEAMAAVVMADFALLG